MIPVIVENPTSFTPRTGLVECENECGNMTHSTVRFCGECLEEGSSIDYKNQRDFSSARRFFISGN